MATHFRFFSPRNMRREGFTLIEVLVSILIIGVLSSLVFCVTNGAMKKVHLVEDMAASRRLIQAYLSAATDNNGILPKGRYADGEAPDIIMPNGAPLSTLTQKVVLTRYPWHLGRYLGWDVESTYLTWVNRKEFKNGIAQLSGMPTMASSQYYYMISICPAFGQNAYGVGGYENSVDSEAATRLSGVPSPSKLIAFVSSKDDSMNGYSFVEPPSTVKMTLRFDGSTTSDAKEWSHEAYQSKRASSFGFIALNHQSKAIAVFLDGHTALLGLDELRDSRLWSRVAQEKDDPNHFVAK